MRGRLLLTSALCAVLTVTLLSRQDKAALTNQDVIRLTRSGLSGALVIRSIGGASKTKFDLSTDGLLQLQAAKVPEDVIAAMMTRQAGDVVSPSALPVAGSPPPPSRTGPAATPVPEHVGVYLADALGFTEVNPELVHWKTGGFWKRTVTLGTVGGHINGTIAGQSSRLQVRPDVEFVILPPEGTAITEYQLLRLDVKEESREFRILSTSIVGAKSGSDRNLAGFDSARISARAHRVRLHEGATGEYGFLPPGAPASPGAVGKIYSFSIR